MSNVIRIHQIGEDPFKGRHPREVFGAALIEMSLFCGAVKNSDEVTVSEAAFAAILQDTIDDYLLSDLD